MKKYLLYYIFFLVLTAIAVLLFNGGKEKAKQLDGRITFRKQDKIPYGTYAAFDNLKYMFPRAAILTNKDEPGYWDSLSTNESGQALIIVAPYFFADEYEMKKLAMFVESGNDVLISSAIISSAAEEILKCKTSMFGVSEIPAQQGKNFEDSLTVSLFKPPYPDYSVYNYPGFSFNAWAYESDTTINEKLGGDELKRNNFLHLRAGKGNLYLHLAPMAFSNYFLLHKNNIEYYEKVFSVISPHIRKIVWDEYYLRKKSFERENKEQPGWFNVLLRFPALKAALLTSILILLLYVFIEMRRKQRAIPIIAKPRNDSLDFVKTIGRLYHDKRDHKNLCNKMSSYFLEYIRTRYKLLTNRLDEAFIESLHLKSGYPKSELNRIISFINYLEGPNAISDEKLIAFHKQLESFYKNA